MKNYILLSLAAAIFLSTTPFVSAGEAHQKPKDATTKQYDSSAMRLEYYNKYKAKGYDVSSLKPFLDGSTTSESQFWDALKQMQNNHEIKDRRAYVTKLQDKGYDVSGFTETVMWDSGKFWEMVKMVESGKKSNSNIQKEEYKKDEKMKYTPEKEKPTHKIKVISQAQREKLRATMLARIAKIPESQRQATLVNLETKLVKVIESSRKNNAKLLAARYEVLLEVVREEMDNIDDEVVVESLFQ